MCILPGDNYFYETGANPNGWGDYAYEPLMPSLFPSGSVASLTSGAGALSFADTWTSYAVDDNDDGIFDALAIDVQLDATPPGDYSIFGYLSSANQLITSRPSADSTVPFDLLLHVEETGPVTVTVRFSGEDIFQSGLDGLYTVQLLASDGTAVIDFEEFDLNGYSHTEFGETPLQILDTVDAGRDEDDDGKLDDLVVSVTVDARAASNGWLEGALYASTGDLIVDASVPLDVTAGGATAELVFDGTQILRAGLDGPYFFEGLFFDEALVQVASYAEETQAYNHLDFEAQGQLVSYSDHGEDTNSNGQFDLLVIEPQLEVTTAGDYTIEASLYDANGNEIQGTIITQTLTTGENAFRLEFSGPAIHDNGVDGPFYLRYVALRESEYLDYSEDAFATSAYSFTEFEAPLVPAVALTGVYSDSAVDSDDNGLYNYLDVNVEILVVTSGTYDLNARLMDGLGREIAWADTSATISAEVPQTLTLRYDGAAIGANAVNGPFVLQDVHVYDHDDVTRSDTAYQPYQTPSYQATQFEGYAARSFPTADIIDVVPDPRHTAVNDVTITFSEAVTGVDISDFSLSRDGTAVNISGLAVTSIDSTQYTIDLSTVTAAEGPYTFTLAAAHSGIEDMQGDPLATDSDDQFTIDHTAPVADVADVSPDLRNSPVDDVTITFNEAVTGVDISDFSLSVDGTATDISGLAVTQVEPAQYTIDLSTVTGAEGLVPLHVDGRQLWDRGLGRERARVGCRRRVRC